MELWDLHSLPSLLLPPLSSFFPKRDGEGGEKERRETVREEREIKENERELGE